MLTTVAQEKQYKTEMIEQNETDSLLLQEWQGPYGGVPAFDQMDLDKLQPAMEKAMKMHLEEIDEIASNSETPTFENTIVAMEKAGKPLERVFTYYGIWSSNISSPEFRTLQSVLAPKFPSILPRFRRTNYFLSAYKQSTTDPRATHWKWISNGWCN